MEVDLADPLNAPAWTKYISGVFLTLEKEVRAAQDADRARLIAEHLARKEASALEPPPAGRMVQGSMENVRASVGMRTLTCAAVTGSMRRWRR